MPSRKRGGPSKAESEAATEEKAETSAATEGSQPTKESAKADPAPSKADPSSEPAPADKEIAEEASPKKDDKPQANGDSEDAKKKEDEKAKDSAEDKPAENGEGGEEKAKKKEVKKTIPRWATLTTKSEKASASQVTKEIGPGGMAGVVVDVMEDLTDGSGSVTISAIVLKKEILKQNPTWKKFMLKKAIAKALEKGRLKQVKGSFKLLKAPPAKASKVTKKDQPKAPKVDKLDDLIGNIFTWVCEPKESSVNLIKKYIAEHHTKLNVDKLSKAIEAGIKKGQLERITGQGGSGTVGLVDKAKKTGTDYEDAIEDAIIACNEPKDASVAALKHYLAEYHTEFNVAARPKVLQNCLERCEAKGWIKRVTGRGMSGTFRLAVPYRPSPRELWGEWYEEEEEEEDEPKPKRKKKPAKQESSDEEESEDEYSGLEDSEEEDDEPVYVPRKGPRGAPKVRKNPPPKPKKKAALVVAKKSKPPPASSPKKKAAKKSPKKAPAKKKAPPKKKQRAKKLTRTMQIDYPGRR